MINKESFIQDVKRALSSFITNNIDVYAVFDYDTVRRVFNDIEDGKAPNKPVLHLVTTGVTQGVRTTVGDENGDKVEGRKNYIEVTIYSVINNNYKDDLGRGFVLDQVTDDLRNLFDSQGDSLPFNQIKFTPMTNQLMGENADGMYALEHELEFWVIKIL